MGMIVIPFTLIAIPFAIETWAKEAVLKGLKIGGSSRREGGPGRILSLTQPSLEGAPADRDDLPSPLYLRPT